MRSEHKMVLGLALIGLFVVAVQQEFRHDPRFEVPEDVVTGGENAIEYSEKSMKDYPRGPLPMTNPASWIISEDYPSTSMYSEFEGKTSVRLAVDSFGEVRDCTVTASSGVIAFDRKACSALEVRARFYPALDEHQAAIESSYVTSVVWQLSE